MMSNVREVRMIPVSRFYSSGWFSLEVGNKWKPFYQINNIDNSNKAGEVGNE